MKGRFIIGLVGLNCALRVGAQTMDFDKLPPAVQETIAERTGPDKIKSIKLAAQNGIAGYVVEFGRRGFNPKLVVAPDGTVIEDHRFHVPTPKDENGLKWDLPEPAAKWVRLSAVPVAVRNRISREARGRPVGRIKSKPFGDQQVFAVEFKQRGPNERVYILENGSLLAEQFFAKNESGTGSSGLGAPPHAQTGSAQVRRLRLEEAPLEVQNAVRKLGGTADPLEFEQAKRNGQSVFRVLVNENSKLKTIRISEDGTILE